MTAVELPEVTEVQRLRLEPGDSLVVHVDDRNRHLTMANAADLQGRVRAVLGLASDFPVLVLPHDMSLEVVSWPEDSGAPAAAEGQAPGAPA